MRDRALFEAARTFASIARELSVQPDLAATRQHVVEVGAKLTGCAALALVRVGPTGRVSLVAASDERLVLADLDVANSTQSGPTVEAARHGAIVVCNDLRADTRWAAYSETIVAKTEIRSVISYPLALDGRPLGVLTGYGVETDYFTSAVTDLGLIYADHAAIGLALSDATERVSHLEAALSSNREIGAAIGIVMSRRGIGNDAAFELIRRHSQHRNVKLRDVAREIVVAGELAQL